MAAVVETKSNKVGSDPAARKTFEELMLRRFFYVNAFEIYGGVGGLYDYGPCGCAVFTNLLAFWRQHFVLHEDMLEISSVSMTPEIVLQTSGHVAKFTDFMVKDEKTGECFRADKMLEEALDALIPKEKDATRLSALKAARTAAGAMKQEELQASITKWCGGKAANGNPVSAPYPFNLMFKSQIGPQGNKVGYLRPETAQGIFVNFKRLYNFNSERMPFAAAQVGPAFRNEIAPRSGLLRVREFTLAEIEHFCNPADKRHPKFREIADLEMSLLSRDLQTGEDKPARVTAGDAVARGVINNETLAYFMARTQMFLTQCGIPFDNLRFRQHQSDEMAHYAQDCWDAEIKSSFGWIECVGHADRSAYDLESHSKASGEDLTAMETFKEPLIVDACVIETDAGKIGKTFRGDQKKVNTWLQSLATNLDEAKVFADDIKKGSVKVPGVETPLTPDMIKKISFEKKTIHSRRYTPHVIEPSYGIGRIFYSILENSYYVRPGSANGKEIRAVLKLPAIIAPVKCSVLPLTTDDKLVAEATALARLFVQAGLSNKLDSSGVAIGRKYARTDEIGIPFAVTIDGSTDGTVTLRERDSTKQIRVPSGKVVSVVHTLVSGLETWESIFKQFPEHVREEKEEEEPVAAAPEPVVAAKKEEKKGKKEAAAKKDAAPVAAAAAAAAAAPKEEAKKGKKDKAPKVEAAAPAKAAAEPVAVAVAAVAPAKAESGKKGKKEAKKEEPKAAAAAAPVVAAPVVPASPEPKKAEPKKAEAKKETPSPAKAAAKQESGKKGKKGK